MPACRRRAAAAAGIPYILLEQNAVPGPRHALAGACAALVCSAMEEVRSRLRSGCRVRRDRQSAAASSSTTVRRRMTCPIGWAAGGGWWCWAAAAVRKRSTSRCRSRCTKPAPRCTTGKSSIRPAQRNWRPRASCIASWDCAPPWRRSSRTCPSCCAQPPGDQPCGRHDSGRTGRQRTARDPAAFSPRHRRSPTEKRRPVYGRRRDGNAGPARAEGRLDNHLARTIVELATGHRLRVRMAEAITRLARPDATRHVARAIVALLDFGPVAAL